MLKRRLERLEANIERQEILVIISYYYEPSGRIKPVFGYQVGNEQLLRNDNETDEQLEDRACAAISAQAQKNTRVLRLNPITEEELCEV